LSSNLGLHNESPIILLDDDHVAIELPNQSGKGWVDTIVQVLLVFFQEYLSDGKQNWVSQICVEKIPLR
jgi:hypothetical protein